MLARTYPKQAPRVVTSENGWFAVVLGPYAATDIGAFRQSYVGPALPPDARVTIGIGYVETVWQSIARENELEAAPAASPTPVISAPAVGSFGTNVLCAVALNSTKQDWDTDDRWVDYVAEALRRNLNVDDCRSALGLPNRGIAAESVRDVCRFALNYAMNDWDSHSSRYAPHVSEAKRRNLNIDDCRVALGLPAFSSSPVSVAAKPLAVLCLFALTNRKDDWDTRALFSEDVAEVRRRNLRVDDCRIALGLPSLRPGPPPVAEQAHPPAPGATIKVERPTEKGRTTIIYIEGELIYGDEKRFADAAIGVAGAVVVLISPGGSLFAGTEIGRAIRLKGFSTAVPEGFQCASACAWAWLAGSPRYMGKGATVGFHAAYEKENGQIAVSSSGNAVVGAYLSQLGLQTPAIEYITEAQPNDMHWLTFEEAEQNGIEVRMFPSE